MEQEDLNEKDLTLSVMLPEGQEKTVTVNGSKPVMDVLVILCARYHLNPSDHVIELFSLNHNKLKFQPSSLIGSLEAEVAVLKPKRSDVRKTPNVPVATVRLLINYRKSHKAVVRVSPRVPLAELMPAVCEKCEMDPKNTVLLRDSQSEEPLDLTRTLNDYGIRDVYARDWKKEKVLEQEKVLGEKENRGLLGLFRRSKKSPEEIPTNTDPISAATSLVLKDQHEINTPCSEDNSASEMPKKRRAPQPPSIPGSGSVSAEPSSGQRAALSSAGGEKEGVLSRVSSTESSLKRNKRRAPPPPCISPALANKERSSILENEEDEAVLKRPGSFNPSRSSIPRSPLMTEVVSELTDRIKSMERKDASFDWSVIPSRPAPNLPPVSGSVVDADLAPPPACDLTGSPRDGLNTFTVVPQKRQQSTRQYEFLLTMKNEETIKREAGEHLEERISEPRETEKIEMSSKETLEKTDDEYENVVETNQELGIAEEFGKLHLNIDAEEHLAREHLAKEHPVDKHLAVEDLIEEHLADNHLAKEHLVEEQLAKEHLVWKPLTKKHLAKEHLVEKQLTDEQFSEKHLVKEYLQDEHPTETNVSEERDEMEDQIEKDWIKEYTKRRRRFLSDSDKRETKLKTSRKAFHEEMLDDVLPSQLSVCWEEEEEEEEEEPETSSEKPEGLKKEKTEEDKSTSTLKNPNPSTSEEPCIDVNLPFNLHSSNSTAFTRSSPNSPSLFSLAVSQRVQSLGINPLVPSLRTTNSPAPHLQRVGSQHASSQKLYFQSLISEEIVSKFPGSLDPCGDAPPTSTAPPTVFTTQARRQSWSSFSRAQLKNLDPV